MTTRSGPGTPGPARAWVTSMLRRKLGAGSLAVATASNIRHLTDVLLCNLHETCHATTGTTQPAAADRILRPEVSVPRSAKWWRRRRKAGPLDVARLRESFAHVTVHGHELPLFFSSDLFLKHPEVRDMVPVSMAAQRSHLAGALGKIVEACRCPLGRRRVAVEVRCLVEILVIAVEDWGRGGCGGRHDPGPVSRACPAVPFFPLVCAGESGPTRCDGR